MASNDLQTEAENFVANQIRYDRNALPDLLATHSTREIASKLGVVPRTVNLWKQTLLDPNFKNPRKPGADKHGKIVSMLRENKAVLKQRAEAQAAVKIKVKGKITLGKDKRNREISHTLYGNKAQKFLDRALSGQTQVALDIWVGDYTDYEADIQDATYDMEMDYY